MKAPSVVRVVVSPATRTGPRRDAVAHAMCRVAASTDRVWDIKLTGEAGGNGETGEMKTGKTAHVFSHEKSIMHHQRPIISGSPDSDRHMYFFEYVPILAPARTRDGASGYVCIHVYVFCLRRGPLKKTGRHCGRQRVLQGSG